MFEQPKPEPQISKGEGLWNSLSSLLSLNPALSLQILVFNKIYSFMYIYLKLSSLFFLAIVNVNNFNEFFLSVSEPECKVIRDLTSRHHFDAFISFHSGQRKILFPNGILHNLHEIHFNV